MIFGLIVLSIILFIFFYIYIYRLRKIKPSASASKKYVRPPDQIFKWPTTEDYNFEIVGESHYQNTIQKFAGDHDEYGAYTECVALLIPEDDNKYDNKAIRVDINAQTVGYLRRDNARNFRRRLGQKKLTGQITECNAKIFGGKIGDDGSKHYYGIWLDLKEFDD